MWLPPLKRLGQTSMDFCLSLLRVDDLESQISFLNSALGIVPEGLNDRAELLDILAAAHMSRFKRSENLDDLDNAIRELQSATFILPKGDVLYRLGTCLNLRYRLNNDLDNLDNAIFAFRRALELTLDDHSERLELRHCIIHALWLRYKHTADNVYDLNRVIHELRLAIQTLPGAHRHMRSWLRDLADLLHRRFYLHGDFADFDAAVIALRDEIASLPHTHCDKPKRLHRLYDAMRAKFERNGDLADLENAASALHSAIELTPLHHTKLTWSIEWLGHIGAISLARFENTGRPDSINRIVSAYRHVIGMAADGRDIVLRELGTLILRFCTSAQENDYYDDVAMLLEPLLELIPDTHAIKGKVHEDVARLLRHRPWFTCIPSTNRAAAVVLLRARALEYTHTLIYPGECDFFNTWRLLKDKMDQHSNHLACAVLALRLALALASRGSSDTMNWLSQLRSAQRCLDEERGGGLYTCSEMPDQLAMFNNAMSALSRAVNLLPDDDERTISALRELGSLWRVRSQRSGNRECLNEAIALYQRAVQITPDEHPSKPLTYFYLGLIFQQCFDNDHDRKAFDDASASFLSAVVHPLHPRTVLLEHLEMAYYHAQFLSRNLPGFSSPQCIVLAYSRIMKLVPETVWLGESVQERYVTSSLVGPVVNSAVSTAISAGALPLAVEWLSAGRSLIWSQTPLSLHRDLLKLKRHRPDLSHSMTLMLRKLEQRGDRVYRHLLLNGDIKRDHTVFRSKPARKASDRYYELRVEYDRLVSLIRGCTGFQNFLRPPRLKVLMSLVSKKTLSTVVFINVDAGRGFALILLPTGSIVPVALPDLTYDRVEKLSLSWSALRGRGRDIRSLGHVCEMTGPDLNPLNLILESLWLWVVHPILQAFYLTSYHDEKKVKQLPHITWCPTGPLTQLPLHAAGKYSEITGPRVFNFVVSSYTPSLAALVRCCQGVSERRLTQPSALIVTQQETPNLEALPNVVLEGRRLQKILRRSKIASTPLHHKNATVKSVSDVISRHAWVHLACHGSQDQNDPTKSAFALYDGSLTLRSLMDMKADYAELAFLSACQTAMGDNHVPEESAHLAAGMLGVGFKGVVGTMWAIRDADAPVVVEAFYGTLIELRQNGSVGSGETGAAYALHEATKCLREKIGEGQFARWAPFVHFGV